MMLSKVRAYNLIIYVKTSIQNYEKGFHSPIFAIDESQRSSFVFVSLEEFQLTLHVLKRSLHFHFTANISKLFMLLSTGNITLCENIREASEMTKKVSIRLLLFLMKVTVQVPCSFHS